MLTLKTSALESLYGGQITFRVDKITPQRCSTTVSLETNPLKYPSLNQLTVIILQVVGLNFSSATSPELLLKTFDHYCEYRRTPNGIVLAPVQLGKWMVLFCDEINLPDMDHYGKNIHNCLAECNEAIAFALS